jgi:bacteriorhodopsin
MKDILDIVVLVLFVYLLFVFLRGFNEEQVEKHKDLLEKAKKRREELEDD